MDMISLNKGAVYDCRCSPEVVQSWFNSTRDPWCSCSSAARHTPEAHHIGEVLGTPDLILRKASMANTRLSSCDHCGTTIDTSVSISAKHKSSFPRRSTEMVGVSCPGSPGSRNKSASRGHSDSIAILHPGQRTPADNVPLARYDGHSEVGSEAGSLQWQGVQTALDKGKECRFFRRRLGGLWHKVCGACGRS